MTFSRLIRRAVWQWQDWRARKERHRQFPELAELDRRRTECRRSHKRGAAAIDKQAFEIMTAALSGRGRA